jgi:hypothetical protein
VSTVLAGAQLILVLTIIACLLCDGWRGRILLRRLAAVSHPGAAAVVSVWR